MLDIFKFIFSYLISNFILVLNISAVGLPNYYIIFCYVMCIFKYVFTGNQNKIFQIFFFPVKKI